MDEVKGPVREYILSEHLRSEDPATLMDGTPLQTSGIIDSLALAGLVAFLEQRFQIQLDVSDTGVEELDSIDDIVRLVCRKREAGRSPSA